jgi:hypothetical protein
MMGGTIKPGSGKSSGRVNYTEGSAGRIHVTVADSTNPSPANPNKPVSPKPPVHGWQNGSYCPTCGGNALVAGGCRCGSMRGAAQMPRDTDRLDNNRSAAKRPTTPGRV